VIVPVPFSAQWLRFMLVEFQRDRRMALLEAARADHRFALEHDLVDETQASELARELIERRDLRRALRELDHER
jgi:hypothetical protein